MRTIRMLTWFTQLGLSVVTPLVVFLLGAVWLRERFGLGGWGDHCRPAGGALQRRGRVPAGHCRHAPEAEREEKNSPPTSFNDHS